MPIDADGNWTPGYVAEHYVDELQRKAAEVDQATGVLQDHLRSVGEQFGKLKLKRRQGDNWFEFDNPTAGTTWILDANPTRGVNHWTVARTR